MNTLLEEIKDDHIKHTAMNAYEEMMLESRTEGELMTINVLKALKNQSPRQVADHLGVALEKVLSVKAKFEEE